MTKCVRWNSPFYGIEGRGWFMSYRVYTRYVKVTFFEGTSGLQPVPARRERRKHALGRRLPEDAMPALDEIAKADGDAPVQAYKRCRAHRARRDQVRRLELALLRHRRQGWFMSYRSIPATNLLQRHVAATRSASGKDEDMRSVDVYQDALDEEEMTAWVRQAAALPGWELTRKTES